MRKLVYRGYILSNTDGLTDSWTLTIGQTSRTGSLFELRRQINFFEELGILPQPKMTDQQVKGYSSAPQGKTRNKQLSPKKHFRKSINPQGRTGK